MVDAVACFLTSASGLRPRRAIGQRYYLLSTPRSGSTFFCDMLTRTEVLGRPTEHLKPWLRRYLVAAGIPLPTLLERLHAQSATANGVFGSKIIINDLFDFLIDFETELLAELSTCPTLLLVRSDKAAQALSNVRSNQLSLYHVSSDGEAEARQKLSTFKIDYGQVFAMERWLLRQEADLLDLLRRNGIKPHLLSYDACVQSRQGAEATIEQVAAILNVDPPHSLSWPELIKIGDLASGNHLAHYQALRRGVHLFSTRSEPWLGQLLGAGWRHPERWGVRSGSLELTLRLPARLGPSAIELLIVLESGNCPSELSIGATKLRPPCPPTGSSVWRVLAKLEQTTSTKILSMTLSDGAIGLEEVVLYEQIPGWHWDDLQHAGTPIPAAAHDGGCEVHTSAICDHKS